MDRCDHLQISPPVSARGSSRVYGGSATDRRAISELHARDEAASKKQDFSALRALLSKDAVVLAPGARPKRGRDLHQNFGQKASEMEVLEYRFEWEEVRILGTYAFEWGRIVGRVLARPTEESESQAFNVMRILKKVGSDSWKVHRTIWNSQN